MPIYSIKCAKCRHAEDIFRSLAQYDDLPDHCGQRMQRVICAPHVMADIQPYKSMITGEMIGSRSRHREHLKDHNMIELGNEKPDFKRKEMPEVPGLREELCARISG